MKLEGLFAERLVTIGCSSAHGTHDNSTPDGAVAADAPVILPDAPPDDTGSGIPLKTVGDGVASHVTTSHTFLGKESAGIGRSGSTFGGRACTAVDSCRRCGP